MPPSSSTLRSLKERYGMLLWVLVLCVILVGAGTGLIIYRMVKATKEKNAASPSPAATASKKEKDSFENTTAGIEQNQQSTEGFNAAAHQTRELVYLYEPSCPFCVKFAPIWAEFEQQYAGPLILRKCTASSPEGQNFNVTGVPAVYLVIDGKQDKPFNDARKVENLMRFAKDNEQ